LRICITDFFEKPNVLNLETASITIFNETNTKLKAMQVKYDDETGQSINEEKLAE
jgi:elongation factor P--beta-lysine ligase